MKLDRVLSVAVTEDEYNIILKKLTDVVLRDGKAISMSKFLRANMILPLINGAAPQETPSVTIDDPSINVKKDLQSVNEDKPKIDSEWNDL